MTNYTGELWQRSVSIATHDREYDESVVNLPFFVLKHAPGHQPEYHENYDRLLHSLGLIAGVCSYGAILRKRPSS